MIDKTDGTWLKAAPTLLRGHEEGMPPVGKNNAGQKLVFWSAAICLVVLLVTGVMFWQPWFADAFPVPIRRIAVVLHAFLGDRADPHHHHPHLRRDLGQGLDAQAMTRGTVSEGWARFHHPLWWRQLRDK